MFGWLQKTACMVSLALVAASVSANPGTGGVAHIEGRITSDARSAVLNSAPPLLTDGWSRPVNAADVAIEVSADGSFEAAVPVSGPSFHRLTVGRTTIELFLEPGYESQVVFGGAGLEFEGHGAELNRILQRVHQRLEVVNREISQDAEAVFTADLQGYRQQVEPLRDALLQEHASLIAEAGGAPEFFSERTRADIVYWFKDVAMNYPRLHHEFTGNVAEIPENYVQDIAKGELDHTRFLSSRRYIEFLDAYVRLMSYGDLMYLSFDLPKEELLSKYEAIAALETSPEIEQYFLGEMFRNFMISYGPRDWGRVLERLEADQPNHPVVADYRPRLDKAMARREAPDEIRVFKRIGDVELEVHLFYPDDMADGDKRPAYVFFHGGGWEIGTPEWGYTNCKRMAELGMVAASFEYRIADVHGTGMWASVEDVQSAVRWARTNLPIDENRVVAAGFSAGGHLAMTTAVLDIVGPEDPSPRPNALIIQSSSYNLTKGRFFDAMTGSRATDVSLTHQVSAGLVPTILFHGEDDYLAPLSEFEEFVARMEALGNDFEKHVFPVGHFFRNDAIDRQVDALTDDFLVRRGFIKPIE